MTGVPVTVLMTVRNGEPYIEAALRSIVEQTLGDFKFLILDNASTDRSREIVRNFLDSRIELVELERDLGQTGALNLGLGLVNTPYVARMDADDISHPKRLERQVEFLLAHPQVALLGAGYEVIDLVGTVVMRYKLPFAHLEILKGMLFENQFVHSGTVYLREAALRCGGYDTSYRHAQDYALWWRIGLAHEVANVPEFLIKIRTHPGQVTHEFGREAAEEPFAIVRNALADPRLPEEARRLRRSVNGYADVKYAAAISGKGMKLEAMPSLIRGVFRDPSLVLKPSGRSYITQALLGKAGFDAARGWKTGLSNSKFCLCGDTSS